MSARSGTNSDRVGTFGPGGPTAAVVWWGMAGSRSTWVAGTVLAAAVAGAVTTRARLRNWGATPEEVAGPLPGDDYLGADSTSTRAIAVTAPSTEIWPWLVQLGQDRGGWYSYDWLEDLFGLDIHSTDEVHPEWQRRGHRGP